MRLHACNGDVDSKTPGLEAQAALRALALNGMKIGRIEDVPPPNRPNSLRRRPSWAETLNTLTRRLGKKDLNTARSCEDSTDDQQSR
jgi:hypothetical protein